MHRGDSGPLKRFQRSTPVSTVPAAVSRKRVQRLIIEMASMRPNACARLVDGKYIIFVFSIIITLRNNNGRHGPSGCSIRRGPSVRVGGGGPPRSAINS